MGYRREDRLIRVPVALCVAKKYQSSGGVVDGGCWQGAIVVILGTGEILRGLGCGPRK
jgi:hypothetical protein